MTSRVTFARLLDLECRMRSGPGSKHLPFIDAVCKRLELGSGWRRRCRDLGRLRMPDLV
jgi:hypothetical protein